MKTRMGRWLLTGRACQCHLSNRQKLTDSSSSGCGIEEGSSYPCSELCYAALPTQTRANDSMPGVERVHPIGWCLV